jgi:hypothetical protein
VSSAEWLHAYSCTSIVPEFFDAEVWSNKDVSRLAGYYSLEWNCIPVCVENKSAVPNSDMVDT